MLPAIFLGIAATVLTLFVEFQLLKATSVPLGWNEVVQRDAPLVSLERRGGDPGAATLQVRARPIVPGSRTTLVRRGE
jgi:hypothetical protein